MLMIIGHHYALYAGAATAGVLNTFNGLWFQSLRIGGKIGVNIFVMISGYFLVTSKRIRISKIVRLWLQVLTYSIALFVITSAINGNFDLSYKSIKAVLLPISHDTWWFATTYFLLFLLSPFLNRMMQALSRRGHLAMLFVMFVMFSVLPTFLLQSIRLREFTWFLFIYCLAGYIRLHGFRLFKRTVSAFIAATVAYLSNFGLRVLFMELGKKSEFFNSHSGAFCDLNTIPVLIVALLIFLAFEKLDIGSSRVINVTASAAFGVYLIHEYPPIREWLKQTFFLKVGVARSDFFPYTVLVILGIYVACAAAELIRIYLLEKNYMRFFEKREEKIYGAISRAFEKVSAKLSKKNEK